MIEPKQLKRIIEGALLAAGKPLTLVQLGELFPLDQKPQVSELKDALSALEDDFQDRGFELKEVGNGWRIQVCQDLSEWVGRLWEEKPARYSRALLETLALVAYRQPVTRGEIEDVRGVAVSTNIIRTLLEREWVRVVGHRDVPGRPAMYATTRHFLDYFNLKALNELPPLSEIRDFDKINAELDFTDSQNEKSDDSPEERVQLSEMGVDDDHQEDEMNTDMSARPET